MKPIDTLEPSFKEQILHLLIRVEEATGLKWIITSGRRSMKEQAQLYAKGRTAPGQIVTRAKPGDSPHNFGMAADFAPLKNGEPNWPRADDKAWYTLGFIAESMGLTWGGHFRSITDVPHVESGDWHECRKQWIAGKLKID